MIAKVLSVNNGIYNCIFSDNTTIRASLKGTLKRDLNLKVRAGDNVFIENGVINKVMPRKNLFIRPVVANVDKIFIVTSLIEPSVNFYLLDKMIVYCLSENIFPTLIFTKLDLIGEKQNVMFYEKLGFKLIFLPGEEDALKEMLTTGLNLFIGQTGAGKTTILNSVDKTLNLKVQKISKALNRGKNTTTVTTLFRYHDGFIVDSPGFGNIDLKVKSFELRNYFPEFKDLDCKYKTCLHENEPGCKFQNLVEKTLKSRYNNYIAMLGEIKLREEKK